MGQDGNTIEIEIDAAATQAAAKTAGEANAKLEEFNNALKLFRDNVGTISETTDSVAGKIGDFNTLLQTFSDKLTENLANMQTSVVAKVEPHLERELENLVNRVTNKVEAKYKPETESRSRSEAKSGPAAPAIKVAQPPEYKQPDVKVKSTFTKLDNQTVDSRTGEVKETPIERARTTATRTRHWQEEIDGQLHDFTETITDVSSSVKKATTAEKDRGLAIRREITGALIGLHVMKVVSQYSAVFNAGFMQIAAAIGHLLNNLLLPMMPMFTQVAQFLHMLANVIAMLPMPVRQLIGTLLIWKATSMMVAGLPIKDFADGIRMVRDNLRGSGDLLAKFGRGIVALIKFMNTNLMNDKIDAVAGWAGRGLRRLTGKRAGGGPVLGHGAYIVGEKGPEIFVPKVSGAIIPNHKIGRAGGSESGNDVVAAPFGGDIMGNLGTGLGVGGLAYMLTGSPLLAAGLGAGAGILGPAGIANMIGSAVSSDIGSNMIASLNVMTGMISSILAPLAPIMGVVGALLGVVTGARAAGGGGGDRTAETVAKFGNEQLKTTGKMSYGIQNATAMSGRGINKILSMILVRLGNCLYVSPCTPDVFAIGTTLTAMLPTALKIALGALAGIITYQLITEGILPPLAMAGVISYAIKTTGVIPEAINKTATITYEIVKKGTEPIAQSRVATITYNIIKKGTEPLIQSRVAQYVYNIVKNGIEPIAESKTADITYNIVKNGYEPIAKSLTAYIEYVIKTTGKMPTVENIVAQIEAKFGPLSPEEIAKLKAAIEAASKANPAKIAVASDGTAIKVGAEATKLADKIPAGEKVIKEATTEANKLAEKIPAGEKVIREATAEADKITDKVPTEKKIIEGIKAGVNDVVDKVPETKRTLGPFKAAVSDINVPKGLDLDVNPKVDEAFLRAELDTVFKNLKATRKLLMQAEFPSETYTNLQKQIDDMVFDAKKIELRIAEVRGPTGIPLEKMVIDIQGSLTKLDKSLFIGDTIPDMTGEIWRVTQKAGLTYTLENIDGVVRTLTVPDSATKEVKIWEAKVEKLTPTEKSITTMSDIISKRLASGEPSKAPVKPAVPEGFDYTKVFSAAGMESAGRAAGGFGVAAIGAYFSEWNATGKPPELGDFMTRMVLGGIALMLLPVVGNALGAAIGGATGAAVATGAGLVAAGLTALFVGAVALCAADMAWDLMSGVAEAVRTGDWSNMNFGDNPVLNWFYEQGNRFTVEQGNSWVLFENNLRSTLANGVPVDVRFDVDSITSVTESIVSAARQNISGNTAAPPTNMSQSVGNPHEAPGPDMSTGNPFEAPGPDMSTGNPLETGGGGMDIGNPLEPRARGGPVRGGGSYLVGERGPEMFVPDRAPAGGGGGNTINFSPTFNVTTNNPKELTDTVMKQLKLELARVKM